MVYRCRRHGGRYYGQFTTAPRPRTPFERNYSDRKLRSPRLRGYGINEKTVIAVKRRGRADGTQSAQEHRLSAVEEAAIVSLRDQARQPLDDVYIPLKDVIPHLSRSSLYRFPQRHGISRLPRLIEAVGLRLFLPNSWTRDQDRMAKAGVPEPKRIARTKPQTARFAALRIRRD